jgi:hypothetical protein
MSMSPRFRHCLSYSSPDPCSHPFSGFMAPLWILGLSLSSLSSSPLFVLFPGFIFPAQPGFVSASPLFPISAFLSSLSISGVLVAQPALSFLASVYSTVVLLSFSSTSIDFRFPLSIAAPTVPQSLWPRVFRVPYPRDFQKGHWRTSWLLPPFILVRLLLLVSCSVRRFRLFLEPPSSVVIVPRYSLTWSSNDRRSLPPRFILSDHRFLFRPVTSCCFMDYIMAVLVV